jgi:hypothetical protein
MQTIFEVNTVTANEEACLSFLAERGVFYKTMECKHCGGVMHQKLARRTFKCTSFRCRKEVSIRHGTFFSGSQLECRKILMIGYLWILKTPTSSIVQMTGCSTRTVCTFARHYRNLCSSHLTEHDDYIGGPGVTVEIDESKLGKRKYNRGHVVDGAWVIGGVEDTPERKVFLRRIESRDRDTLIPIILQHVHPESIIRTDLWRSYSSLADHRYMHETVNHSQHFRDPETGVHTNRIEGTWNGLKLQIKPRNRTKNGIDDHLMEFIWRRKYSSSQWDGFLAAMKDIHYTIE